MGLITKLLSGLPSRTMAQKAFDDAMAQLMVDLPIWGGEVNSLAAGLNMLAAGTAVGLQYTFSSTTTDSDPGTGKLRLSSASQASSGTIRLDPVTVDLRDVTNLINTFDASTSPVKGHIRLVNLKDPTKWMIFEVTARVAMTGYQNISAAPIAFSSTSPFVDGDSLGLLFTRTGDKGATGPAGAGGHIFLGQITPTAGAAFIDFGTIFNGPQYDGYIVYVDNVKGQLNGPTLRFRFAVNGTPDSNISYWFRTNHPGSTTWGGAATSFMDASVGINNNDGLLHAVITLIGTNRTGGQGYFCEYAYSSKAVDNAVYTGAIYGQYFPSGTQPGGFKLYMSSGAFAAGGAVKVFGIKYS